MQLGRVCGQVVSTKKTDRLNGFKILVVQPISLETFEEKGSPFVSLDGVGAGDGELVMCVSGSSSRQTSETETKPVDNLIVAIIDSVDILGTRCFDKSDPDIGKRNTESKNVALNENKTSSKISDSTKDKRSDNTKQNVNSDKINAEELFKSILNNKKDTDVKVDKQ